MYNINPLQLLISFPHPVHQAIVIHFISTYLINLKEYIIIRFTLYGQLTLKVSLKLENKYFLSVHIFAFSGILSFHLE